MKIGRNDPCQCGSDKKYKKCCMDEQNFYQNTAQPGTLRFSYDIKEGEDLNSVRQCNTFYIFYHLRIGTDHFDLFSCWAGDNLHLHTFDLLSIISLW